MEKGRGANYTNPFKALWSSAFKEIITQSRKIFILTYDRRYKVHAGGSQMKPVMTAHAIMHFRVNFRYKRSTYHMHVIMTDQPKELLIKDEASASDNLQFI